MSEEEKKEMEEEQQEEEQQEELTNEEEQQEELTNEEIKRLAEKVEEEEARYILRLSEWNRPGNSFTDYAKIRILEGEIKKVEINHVYDYPTTNQWDYIIIPLTKIVIIKYIQYDDYNGDEDERETLYVFSANGGWKRVDL